ncbi:HPr family phosphocarrier protein [Thalassotalea sp. G20_0]|uniref:HPr family phosphocarrier protein n=1 Tax=Thalassotalea sp. G20_0 TaxID=2821093 RepID=UPI001ADBB769|nr:HPr family phosphocarrier protein [Thalassotalea sp. G20_0]MBO9495154.1 HPr family phosphocarrier protein [Thalassotalea sp. G20_0]
MQTAQIKVTNENGLHTRPGAVFVKACQGFASTVTVDNKGHKADAKSLMKLMSAGITKNDMITLTIEGSDEAAAMEQLKVIIESLIGERKASDCRYLSMPPCHEAPG